MFFRHQPQNRKFACYPRVKRRVFWDLFVAYAPAVAALFTFEYRHEVIAWAWAILITISLRVHEFF